MKIGELFIELGATGGETLRKILGGINSGLKEISNTSLGTKAAIAGTAFAVERMTRFSTQMGASYKKFAGYTGLSTKMLQRWQFAGRQVNVTNQEVQDSFLSVSKAMGDMLIGKGAPEGLAVLADTVGFDPKRAKDTLYVMKKLQEFATKFSGNEALKNKIIESFGIGSTAMIAALKDNAFSRAKMAAAPIFSESEINKLAKMNAKMNEFYNNLKLSMGKLVVEFMPKIVDLMDRTAAGVKDIVFGLDSSSDAAIGFKVVMESIWDIVKMIIDGWKGIFSGVGKVKKLFDSGGFSKVGSDMLSGLKEFGKGVLMDTPFESMITPNAPSSSIANNKEITIKNEMTFGSDQVDPLEIKNNLQGVIESTFRQMDQGAVK